MVNLGLIGTAKGWKVVVGGCAGSSPRIAQLLAQELDIGEAIDLVDQVITLYKKHQKKERIGKMIESMGGIDAFEAEL